VYLQAVEGADDDWSIVDVFDDSRHDTGRIADTAEQFVIERVEVSAFADLAHEAVAFQHVILIVQRPRQLGLGIEADIGVVLVERLGDEKVADLVRDLAEQQQPVGAVAEVGVVLNLDVPPGGIVAVGGYPLTKAEASMLEVVKGYANTVFTYSFIVYRACPISRQRKARQCRAVLYHFSYH